VTGRENGSGNNGSDLKRYGVPAAAGLGTLAATYAARKAPDLVRNKLAPKAEQKTADEAAKVGKQALQQVKGAGPLGAIAGKLAGGGKGGREKTRRLPIQRWTDIAAPRATVYDKWTQFEEYPKFMHRVVDVEQEDDNKIKWQEKIWFSKRQWQAEITEREKNDRIAWKTVSGTNHEGVITFHSLDDKLTRVMVDLDFHPSGMLEKMASGMRFVKRAVQADLARFKAYVELGEAEGLEYSHETEAGGGKQDEDDSDDREPRSRSNGNRSRSEQSSSSDGDKAREERAERREQRRV
jgi:uncharacterized membrane protein